MIHVMEAVKSGELKVNQAAKVFGVPPTTLKDQISGCLRYRRNPGPEPYLTSDEENSLAIFSSLPIKWGLVIMLLSPTV